jgi:hypothetical protein
MKTIQLTKGFVALVDDADFAAVSQYKWRALVDKRRGKVYAVRKAHGSHSTRKSLYLHREILGVTDPTIKVDHRNGDGLDDQRGNLRSCTTAQNNMNQRKRINPLSSRYKGVCWHKRDGKFQAEIKINGKSKFLGMFTDELDAALTYDSAAREHFGEFACCNFPLKKPCTNTSLALESQDREYVS